MAVSILTLSSRQQDKTVQQNGLLRFLSQPSGVPDVLIAVLVDGEYVLWLPTGEVKTDRRNDP